MRSLLLVFGAALLAGCASTPSDALRLRPDTTAHRQMQTREFAGTGEAELLAAGLGVLQDLGFTLDGSDTKLGVVSASRSLTSRRPPNGGEIFKDMLWTAAIPMVGVAFGLYDAAAGVKEPQVVRVSLVTGRGGAGGDATVRVTAQRLVYKDARMEKLLKVEPLDDPAFYREFFARLAQSAFLQAQKT